MVNVYEALASHVLMTNHEVIYIVNMVSLLLCIVLKFDTIRVT